MFAPCGCAGSSRFVHPACLQAWRRARPDCAVGCTTCGRAYVLKRTRESEECARWLACRERFIVFGETFLEFFICCLSVLGGGVILEFVDDCTSSRPFQKMFGFESYLANVIAVLWIGRGMQLAWVVVTDEEENFGMLKPVAALILLVFGFPATVFHRLVRYANDMWGIESRMQLQEMDVVGSSA